MVLRRFQVVEAHGDVRYSTSLTAICQWKKGYLKISWDSAERAWLCGLYFEANDRQPVIQEWLTQKRLTGLPKSPEKAEATGLVHFGLSNEKNIWIRCNTNTYNKSLLAVATILKQIKDGQYEDCSSAALPKQNGSRPQVSPSNQYERRWSSTPQKNFYGQQKLVSRNSLSGPSEIFDTLNRNYERIGTPKTYSRSSNWMNGYKNGKCYSDGDGRYSHSHRRRLTFAPSFSDKQSNVNSFSTSNTNYKRQPKQMFDHWKVNNDGIYTKENSCSSNTSHGASLSHRTTEDKFKTSRNQIKDNLEVVSRSPLKSISRNGRNSETSKRPPLLEFPLPSKRLKSPKSDGNRDGEGGEALSDSVCERATPYFRGNGQNSETAKRPPLLEFPFPSKQVKLSSSGRRDVEREETLSNSVCEKGMLHLRGFENLGNSCYMNSVLQALSNLDPFTTDLLTVNDLLAEKLPERSLIRSLSSLLVAKLRDDSSQIQSLLEEIKEAVCHVASNFKGNYQHDAHEFLGQVLDQIKEEIADEESDASNPVKENFEFDSLKSYLCQGCCQVIAKRETSNMLSLDVPKLRILIIHLKRYSFLQQSVKVAQPVSIPTYLTLQDHVNENISKCQRSNMAGSKIDSGSQLCGSHGNTSTCSEKNECQKTKRSTEENMPHSFCNSLDTVNVSPTFSSTDNSGANKVKDDKVEVINTRRKLRPVLKTNRKYDDITPMTTPRLATVGLCGGREDEGSVLSIGEEENKENHLPNGHSYEFVGKNLDNGDAEPDHEVKEMQTAVEQSLQEAENQEEIELQKALQNSIEDASEWSTKEVTEKTGEGFWIYRSEEQRKAMEENFEKGNLQYSYQLKSIVSHIGHTAQSGHYLCDIYDPATDSWWHFNDNVVQKRTKYEVLHQRQTSGYLFFYVAKEILHSGIEKDSC